MSWSGRDARGVDNYGRGFTVDAFPMQTTLVRRSLKGKLRSAVSIDLTSR